MVSKPDMREHMEPGTPRPQDDDVRLHLGAPREPLFAVIEPKPAIINGDVYPQDHLRPKRQITAMYGLSWPTAHGFVFIGVQYHKKQRGER